MFMACTLTSHHTVYNFGSSLVLQGWLPCTAEGLLSVLQGGPPCSPLVPLVYCRRGGLYCTPPYTCTARGAPLYCCLPCHLYWRGAADITASNLCIESDASCHPYACRLSCKPCLPCTKRSHMAIGSGCSCKMEPWLPCQSGIANPLEVSRMLLSTGALLGPFKTSFTG